MAGQAIAGWDWERFADGPHADKTAFVFRQKPCTYAELGACVNGVTVHYRRLFTPGEIVALWLPNCPEALCACIAALRAHIVAMPVRADATVAELVAIVRSAGVRHLIVGVEQAARIRAGDFADTVLITVSRIEGDTIEPYLSLGTTPENFRPARAPRDAALIIHTSGSSGRPKGVVISSTALAHILAGRIECAAIRENSRAVIASSLAHSVGLYQALAFLAAGASFVLLTSYDVSALAQSINAFRPTHLIMVVAAYAALLRSPLITAESFRAIEFAAVGADRVPEHVQYTYLALTGQTLAITYGMSELSWMLINTSDEAVTCMALGTPAPAVEIRLLDSDGKDVADGHVGEIVARSPKAMLGYLNDSDGFMAIERDGWLRSGDLAYRDGNGLYWFAGRINDLIGLATGDLIAPLEIEQAVLAIPGIGDCAVVGMPSPHDPGAEEPWAIVVRANPTLTAEAIRDRLRATLSDYKLPRTIVFVETIPAGEGGKVSRKELRRWLSDGRAHGAGPCRRP